MAHAIITCCFLPFLASSSLVATTAAGGDGGLPPWAQRLLAGGSSPTLRAIKEGKQKHAVVAKNAVTGDGQFGSIGAALAAAEDPIGSKEEPYGFVLQKISSQHTQKNNPVGLYEEYLNITRKHVILIGQGMGKSVITGNRSVGFDHLSTDQTATVSVHGMGFMAQDLTIRNTAGPAGKQAVALLSRSHNSLVYRCSIEGFQDTLDADTGRQMYLDSYIRGTVDFVFGYARASFLRCQLLLRNSGTRNHNVVTAQGRSDPRDDSGFAFQNCSVMADVDTDLTGVETFLGRPWKPHSHVIFMESFLDAIVNFTGWVEWNRSYGQIPDTVVYLGYGNTGLGADTSRRVKNRDVRLANCSEAAGYTAGRFINASDWMPKDDKGNDIIPYPDGLQRPCLPPIPPPM